MKTLLALTAISLLTILGCQKKEVAAAKDYTSIICKVHDARVYRREFSGASVDYTRAYGQFLLSQDWRAKYPYTIIDSNEDIHAEDETKRFLYHLVCDQCQQAFQREREEFNFDSKDLRFNLFLDMTGTPFVGGHEVSIVRLESMLKSARAKQPGVDVIITVPHDLPLKHERDITRVVAKAGINLYNFKRRPKVAPSQ